MTDAENIATFKAILAEQSPAEILTVAVETQLKLDRLCTAVRRERETAAAGPLDEHLAARAEVDRLVAGEKD